MEKSNKHQFRRVVSVLAGVGSLAYVIWSGWLSPYTVTGAVDAERVYQMAIEKKDITICDAIHLRWRVFPIGVTNRELVEDCYEEFVKAYPDQNVCSRIERNWRCVYARALELDDPTVCFSMNDDRLSGVICVSEVAIRRLDPSVCSLLRTNEERARCVKLYQTTNLSD